jgi:hypothetical protein
MHSALACAVLFHQVTREITMSKIATATLQTPWDCKWSRFGRIRSTNPAKPAEGLWVCVYNNTPRLPITASACETCPHWEYEDPIARAAAVATCSPACQNEKRLEIGVRVAALVLAAVLAATGVAVLTRPLAIPLTIALWMGAVTSFLLGIWGNFNRRFMPTQSW